MKIPDVRIVTGEQVANAEVSVLYNHASDGLAGNSSDLQGFQQIFVDDIQIDPATCNCLAYGGKPGVFILTITPLLLNLQESELREGSYRVKVTVKENGVFYTANAPHALVVQRQETALPETDFLVVLFFALLALFFMRNSRKRE